MFPLLARIPTFVTDDNLPCHEPLYPALWLGRITYSLIIESPEGLSVKEKIERIFYALLVTLALFPVALFTLLVALPLKAIALTLFSDREQIALEEDEEDPLKPPIYVYLVPPDGNCGFEAFLTGMRLAGHELAITDLGEMRIKTALWIKENFTSDPELKKLLLECVTEHLEVKQKWLYTEEEQLMNIGENLSEEEVHHITERLELSPKEKEEVAVNLTRIKVAKDLEPLEEVIDDFLKLIQNNEENERVYPSRAHYYAFTHMFDIPVTLEIYQECRGKYTLVDTVGEGLTVIRFLHSHGDHIDLLIFP